MEFGRTTHILSAFVVGWSKQWNLTTEETERLFVDNPDLFKNSIMFLVDSKEAEERNKKIATLFGPIVTNIRTFPVSDGSWLIIDKHTKRMLHKDIPNENEVNTLCKKNNYLR